MEQGPSSSWLVWRQWGCTSSFCGGQQSQSASQEPCDGDPPVLYLTDEEAVPGSADQVSRQHSVHSEVGKTTGDGSNTHGLGGSLKKSLGLQDVGHIERARVRWSTATCEAVPRKRNTCCMLETPLSPVELARGVVIENEYDFFTPDEKKN